MNPTQPVNRYSKLALAFSISAFGSLVLALIAFFLAFAAFAASFSNGGGSMVSNIVFGLAYTIIPASFLAIPGFVITSIVFVVLGLRFNRRLDGRLLTAAVLTAVTIIVPIVGWMFLSGFLTYQG